ncbi:MAG: hypothetical protein K1X56_04865 [Flavobacteriales bacterium]|nr:hypothetical protein [Flavobacteriales bacterium]
MKKAVKYIAIALITLLVGFLGYRYFYTMFTGPSDEQLKKDKERDDKVVAPNGLNKLEEDYKAYEESQNAYNDSIANSSTATDSIPNH